MINTQIPVQILPSLVSPW